MKFLLLLLVLVVAGLWWHNKRVRDRSRQPDRSDVSQPPQAMVVCPVCRVHLPRAEAFMGRQGAYCSEDHRARHEA
ncbi:MAG: hypothetical protein RL657_908 [Pseudomonadota bacterium]|jgi:uncharacterized protein